MFSLKRLSLKTVLGTLTTLLLVPAAHGATKASADLDSLGVNREMVRRAKKISPNNRVKVVQKRAVDRNLRLETSLGYSMVAGGDPYVDSRQLSVDLDFHINPRWSVGARYGRFDNDLSADGQRIADQRAAQGLNVDTSDFAKDAYMGTVTYYPIYGKINFFNLNVTQFDIYITAGYGQIQLDRSGATDLLTVGGGAGFWLTDWMSARFEVRYQNYEDTLATMESRSLHQTVFSGKLGFLL